MAKQDEYNMDSDSDISIPDGDVARSKGKRAKGSEKRKKGKTKAVMDAVSRSSLA
jgi:hypothetical protein